MVADANDAYMWLARLGDDANIVTSHTTASSSIDQLSLATRSVCFGNYVVFVDAACDRSGHDAANV